MYFNLVCVGVCERASETGMSSDPSQLVPKTGRHEVFHFVCKEAQWCKECAEELKINGKQNQPLIHHATRLSDLNDQCYQNK